jgi:hypothetical protein
MLGKSVRTLLRVATGAAAVMATLNGTAEAQGNGYGARRTQQTAGPAAGSQAWGRDDCSYVFQQGAWQATDICRIRRSATIYDTYSRQTRRMMHRYDESDPRFLTFLDLNAGNPDGWIAMARDGSAIFAKINGQWIDYVAAVRAQAQAQQTAAAQGQRNRPNPDVEAQMAQIRAQIAASEARITSTWLAPNCVSSYNGCR